MNVPLKYADFGDGMAGGGMFLTSFLHGDTKMVVSATLIDVGVVLMSQSGKQLLVPMHKVRCLEALHNVDWLAGEHLKSAKEQEQTERARKAKK